MPRSRLASHTSTGHSRFFSGALVLGLAAFTSGCELVPDTDASPDYSSIPEASTQDAASQNDAAVAADDAALPMQTDAGGLDGSVLDGGAPLDAQAWRDASDADASQQNADAAVLDGTVLDGGAALDAQAALDASGAEASGPDTSVADASAADASGHDAGASDAGRLVRTRNGEVRWFIEENQGSLFCPQQSQLFWKEETITLRDPTSRGFVCDICPNPPFDDQGTTTYYFYSDELDVRFDFFSSVVRGFSVAAFRDSLRFVTVRWKTAPKSPTKEGWTEFSTWSDVPTVEFLSYEAPLLHARLQAVVFDTAVSFNEPVAVPYPCFHGAPPLPDLCTAAICGFEAPDTDPANGVHVTVDITLPVEAPHDGLSPP